MAFDPEFLELMPHTCSMQAQTYSVTGDATLTGPVVTAHCHVQPGTKHVYENGMLTATIDGRVFLDGVYGSITPTWALTIPLPAGDTRVKIINVGHDADEEGYHHTYIDYGAF